MTNKELAERFARLMNEDNFFDMMSNLYSFDRDYKQTTFYKNTKMSIYEAAKYFKLFNMINLDNLFSQIQEKINTLNLENLNNLMDKVANTFNQENDDILNQINEIKKLREEE